MAEGIHHYFEDLITRHEGILAIMVTDRDGVPLVKVADHSKVPQNALRASFLSTFSTTAEQASKLGLLKNKSIVCFFASYQVVHFSFLPLVVSIIATSQANTGLLLGLEKEFEETVKRIKNIVDGV
ncbi:PREDICTED: ragulator complex protein LAMTOR3-A-like [Acropora digitifera]|uniref:ragulator complex protein LAMTOR3-A-like n=1 Tax=Acropora digitifera TaxID=70779 RepID=UPI00077B0B72|nr:PREDICTED: ragulator complex protein LAMTOR3-A-like [Acropora digitifera]XP_029198669.1 ragulator complex protein LAMTOR3-A-like [Acropora millepora]